MGTGLSRGDGLADPGHRTETQRLPEITQDGRFGFLVENATPHGVAQAILDAVAVPDRLAEMGAAAQQYVLHNYSWDRVGERIFSIINGRNIRPRVAA